MWSDKAPYLQRLNEVHSMLNWVPVPLPWCHVLLQAKQAQARFLGKRI